MSVQQNFDTPLESRTVGTYLELRKIQIPTASETTTRTNDIAIMQGLLSDLKE